MQLRGLGGQGIGGSVSLLGRWGLVGVGRDWAGLGRGFFRGLFSWAFFGAGFFLGPWCFSFLSFLFLSVLGGSGVLSHGAVSGFFFFIFSIFLCGHWDISEH